MSIGDIVMPGLDTGSTNATSGGGWCSVQTTADVTQAGLFEYWTFDLISLDDTIAYVINSHDFIIPLIVLS